MKKIIIAALVFVPVSLLSSCTVTEAAYSPGYNNDYVYSVGYYGYRPYWNTYSGGWGNVGYWTGSRGFYNRGWGGRGWGGRGWAGRGWAGHGWGGHHGWGGGRGWGHGRR